MYSTPPSFCVHCRWIAGRIFASVFGWMRGVLQTMSPKMQKCAGSNQSASHDTTPPIHWIEINPDKQRTMNNNKHYNRHVYNLHPFSPHDWIKLQATVIGNRIAPFMKMCVRFCSLIQCHLNIRIKCANKMVQSLEPEVNSVWL